MIDRPQRTLAQPLGQLRRIHPVALVALPLLPVPIAHHHASHVRLQQVVQPLCLGAFLKGHMHRATKPAKEFHDRLPFRIQDRSLNQPPAFVSHRHHRGCLMHIQPDILCITLHESRSLVWFLCLGRLQGNTKGRALNIR
jgi:hypothetical protein